MARWLESSTRRYSALAVLVMLIILQANKASQHRSSFHKKDTETGRGEEAGGVDQVSCEDEGDCMLDHMKPTQDRWRLTQSNSNTHRQPGHTLSLTACAHACEIVIVAFIQVVTILDLFLTLIKRTTLK